MNTDYARFTAKQIEQHCQNNDRSIALNPIQYQIHQRDAQANANRQLADADREVSEFRAWRRQFLEPRYDAWGHLDQACEHAELAAAHAVHRVRALWAALAPLMSEEEQERWMTSLSSQSAENAE